MPPIELVLVSTNVLIRGGIEQVVAKSDVPTEVVGTFASFQEADAFLSGHRVRVLLIDDSLPRSTNLVREVKRLVERYPSLAIVMIAQRPTASLVRSLLDNGVHGLLHKGDEMERGLNQAIQMAARGGIWISPRVSRMIESQQPLPRHLTQRDLDVLQLLAEGFQSKEISTHLGLHRKSVYRILRTLREVLDAHSNAQLIDIAHQNKLLDPQRKV
jgi:two-component system response regulator NreC